MDSDGVGIAYQVLGEGPIDVVMVPGFASHLEDAWAHPRLAHFYRRLASFSRLTLLDKRGVGLPDRVSPNNLPGIEQRKDDLKAVVDAIGTERAQCWFSVRDQLEAIGTDIRGGLHTSEIEMMNGDVGGLGVHIAARLMDLASPGDLIAS